jgi:hypothetical protein
VIAYLLAILIAHLFACCRDDRQRIREVERRNTNQQRGDQMNQTTIANFGKPTQVRVGESVGFKSDYEQYGTIVIMTSAEQATRIWGVWCEVWGGVTGSREAWLKADGKVATFATKEEADAEARDQNNRTANNPRASFRYSARQQP